MDSRKTILKETLLVTGGMAAGIAVMFAIFAALGYWELTVLWGGLIGGGLSLANFLLMSVGVNAAADRAEQQNVRGGQGVIAASFLLRYAGLFLGLFLAAKSGSCNLIALLAPLLFPRIALTVGEFFRKKGDRPV